MKTASANILGDTMSDQLATQEMKAQLDKAGIPYQQDYCDGPDSTDFLIEKDGKRIALECKSNVGRDFEKTVAQADMVMSKLAITTLVVAPYITEITELQTKGGVKIFPLSELTNHLEF